MLPFTKVAALLAVIPSILGSPFEARIDALNDLETSSSLLGARQASPFDAVTSATTTQFLEGTDGFWQLIDADGDGLADLAFIKTRGIGDGPVEVHFASAASNFQTHFFDTLTTFGAETDGTWLLVPSTTSTLPDLAFIKTAATVSGSTEVHIASGASQYQSLTIQSGSTFAEETDGTWSLLDFDGDGLLDLVFIKTANTGGTVEVYVASGASSFQTFIYDHGSTFGLEIEGFWSLVPFASNADLCVIKSINTESDITEVHIASRDSEYETKLLDTKTIFGDQSDATWSLVDTRNTGVLDLVLIRSQNTFSGFVEVYIASGN